MRDLSVMEQKEIVGGGYYYKIYEMNGRFRGKSYTFSDEDECINECIQMVAAFKREDGIDVVGRVYDDKTGEIIFRW